MMKTHICRLTAILVAMAFVTSCQNKEQATTAMLANQDQALQVIQAIQQYENVNHCFPTSLEGLTPDYLSALPTTINDQPFEYLLDDIEGYKLCFYVNGSESRGCCYLYRLDGWDCFFDFGD